MAVTLFVLACLGGLAVFGAAAFAVLRFAPDFLSSFVSEKLARIITVVVMVGLLLIPIGNAVKVWLTQYNNLHWATCHVTHVDQTSKSKRIYTSNCDALEVRDSNWQWNKHSATTFGKVGPGDYKLQIVGTRWPLFSWFPNVLDAKPVNASR